MNNSYGLVRRAGNWRVVMEVVGTTSRSTKHKHTHTHTQGVQKSKAFFSHPWQAYTHIHSRQMERERNQVWWRLQKVFESLHTLHRKMGWVRR